MMIKVNALKPAKKFLYSVRCMSTNYYNILGLKEDATQAQIKAAYREQSKKLHPDLNRNDPNTHDKFIQLKEAYTVLSTPKKKQEYDKNQAVRYNMFRARTPGTDSKVTEHGTLRYTYGGPSPMDLYPHQFGSSKSSRYRPEDINDGISGTRVILGLFLAILAFECCILTFYHFTDEGHRKSLREHHRDVIKDKK